MAGYIDITTTRTSRPDIVVVLTAIKAATGDPTAVLFSQDYQRWRGKKETEWLPAHIVAAQNIIDTTPEVTTQLTAKRKIQSWPIELRAAFSLVLKQFNFVRARLVPPQPALTIEQFMQAIIDEVDGFQRS